MDASNDDPHDRAADSLAAVLAAHEFMLEVIWANILANHTAEQAEAIVADFIRLGGKGYAAPSGDPVVIRRMQALAAMTGAAVTGLATKALRRAREIRERAQASKP